MIHIPKRRGWELAGAQATPEALCLGRRQFLRTVGAAGAALVIGGLAAEATAAGPPSRGAKTATKTGTLDRIRTARRNPRYTLDRALTDEAVATRYNNFYEFTEQKERVWQTVEKFRTHPWRIEVGGLVEKPRAIDVDDLVRALPVEERLYRLRCVERWAMAVPWTGIPMRAFVAWAKPASDAKYVRMVSFLKPDEAPNQEAAHWYAWPYYEALRMDEAMNELALLAVGMYGKPLPRQNGAPIRMVAPWKYGYKSAKSIVRFEFVAGRPRTFWNDAAPDEYSFLSNVDPEVPHPRWSQATERMIGTDEQRPTLPFNGYGEWVAAMYRHG